MEDIEKLIDELQGIYPLNDYGFQKAMQDNLRGFQDMCGEAAAALASLLAENERLRSNCYPRDGVEAIIRERDAYKAELAESQRRERAAVEDAKQGSVCRTCHYLNNGCEPLNLDAGCHKWEWRGPGAGEGEAE